MSDPVKPCKACGAAVEVVALDMFRGVEEPVTVLVNGMPARVCSNGHKRFVYPEFVARLMDFAADAGGGSPQPPAVKRGLFKKHYHCSGCDAELPPAPTAQWAREVDVSFKHAAPFKLLIEVGLHRCTQCGREQVLSHEAVAASAFKALAHGFHAADVHVDN